jgi:hypothetical protein
MEIICPLEQKVIYHLKKNQVMKVIKITRDRVILKKVKSKKNKTMVEARKKYDRKKKRKVKTKKLNQKGGEENEGTVKTATQKKRE